RNQTAKNKNWKMGNGIIYKDLGPNKSQNPHHYQRIQKGPEHPQRHVSVPDLKVLLNQPGNHKTVIVLHSLRANPIRTKTRWTGDQEATHFSIRSRFLADPQPALGEILPNVLLTSRCQKVSELLRGHDTMAQKWQAKP